MKTIRWIYLVSFFVILAGIAAFLFLSPDRAFSEQENRPLEQKPALSLSSIASGDFQDGLNEYLSDQFPLRDSFMLMNTALQKTAGKKLIGGVYLGNDHYYFARFTDADFSLQKRSLLLSAIDEKAEASGVPTTVLLVPTPGVVLSEMLPSNAVLYDAEKVRAAAEEILSHCETPDLAGVFAAEAEQIYYRTDHHWTAYGAYLAYRAISSDPAPYESFGVKTVADSFYGTLYSKCQDPSAIPDAVEAPQNLPRVKVTFEDGTVKDSIYDEEKLSEKDKYTYFFGGNQGIIRIETDAASEKKLLLFKDSFANSLVPFLLGEYREIVMIDLRYFRGDLQSLYDEAPTEVLFCYETSNFLTDQGIIKFADL